MKYFSIVFSGYKNYECLLDDLSDRLKGVMLTPLQSEAFIPLRQAEIAVAEDARDTMLRLARESEGELGEGALALR